MKNKIILHTPDYNFSKENYNEILNIFDLYLLSPIKIIKKLKKYKSDIAFLGVGDIKNQNRLFILKGVLFFIPAKERYLIDNKGNKIKVTFFHLLKEGIIFCLKLILSIGVLLRVISYLIKLSLTKSKYKVKNIKNISYFRTDQWFGIKAGGSVGHIAGVANGFFNLGKKVDFFTSDNLPIVKKEIKQNIIGPSKFWFDFWEINNLYYNFKFIKEIQSLWEKSNYIPNLIYARYSLENFGGVFFSQKYNIPLILEYNGSEVWIQKKWGKPLFFEKIALWIEQINLQHAYKIIVVSAVMKDELIERGIDGNKIIINPNGVDEYKFFPEIKSKHIKEKLSIKNDEIVLGFIGTFGMWHGVEIIAKASKEIIEGSNKKVKIVLIGDGMLRSNVENILKENEIEDKVILTGLIEQHLAPEYLGACDILLSPHVQNPDGTKFFGSPTKLFEYMAMGKVIIASDLDQIGEILEDGKTAIMCEPGNIEDFTNKCIDSINNLKKYKYIGENARKEVIKNYSWNIHSKEILNFIKK